MKYYIITASIFLSACGSLPLTKNVISDTEVFLNENFTLNNISDEAKNKIGIKSMGTIKRIVELDRTMTNIYDDRTQDVFSQERYEVFTNGLSRITKELTNNDFPVSTGFQLEYFGIFDLKYQAMNPKQTYLNQALFAKSIQEVDTNISNPEENKKYNFKYMVTTEEHVFNFQPGETICESDTWIAAETIHNKLTGKALLFECQYFSGKTGLKYYSQSHYYLKDYGISLIHKTSTSKRKREWKTIDVRVLK